MAEHLELLTHDFKSVKQVKTLLEQNNAFIKPMTTENGAKVIKTTLTADSALLTDILKRYSGIETRPYAHDAAETENGITGFTMNFFLSHGLPKQHCEELVNHLPLRYTIYKPLILFNNSNQRSFMLACWESAFKLVKKHEYFEAMLQQQFPQCTHVAVNMPIVEEDVMRRPFNIVALHGTLFDGELRATTWSAPSSQDFNNTLWCHVVQNGIHQVWAPTFTMFSRGNIKEKKRILDNYDDISGHDVVDLYAGIGYFTLSYLKRGARRVFCFELNPWSTEGLRRGVLLNRFEGKCHIYQESNENCEERLRAFQRDHNGGDRLQIRHINLGLLPTSVPGYPIALRVIREYSSLPLTTLHIHENVHVAELQNGAFVELTLQRLLRIDASYNYTPRHVEKIKTFAPDIWHVCLDLDVHKLSS